MKPSSKIAFFGTEDFSAASLKALLAANYPIVCVVTKADAPRGRSGSPVAPKVKTLANDHNIPVLQPTRVAEISEELKKLQPTHGVLVAYGKIIPQSVINLFPGGIINVHPSLLPKYRGPSPTEAAIINGDKKTGITLMQLSAEMDAGPVYSQREVMLVGNETRPQLYGQLAEDGAHFLVEKLPAILSGNLQPSPQNDHEATYTKLLKKTDADIDWSLPADAIERKIRAHLGYPKSKACLLDHDIIITKARAAKASDDGTLLYACGHDTWLEILELIGPSGRTMTGADFVRGYQKTAR